MVTLLLALFGLNLAVSARTSETADERFHANYGLRVLTGQPRRIAAFDNSKMPVSAANALPLVLAEQLPQGGWKRRLGTLHAARLATIVAATALAFLVWRWTRTLYGPIAAGVALGSFVLDPNILAHSHLVTTDIFTALGLFAACWAAWRASRSSEWRPVVVEGALLGAAQLTKYFALMLYPLLAAIELVRARFARPVFAESARPRRLARFAVGVFVSWVVIHLGFGLDRAFTPLSAFDSWSAAFRRLAATPGLRSLPIPLPDAYVTGLDMGINAESERQTFGRVYLLGKLYDSGVPGYYLIASLFKVPLPVLLLGAVAFALYLRRFRTFDFWNDEIYLWAPLLAFSVYLNFFYNAQIGIRHFLIVFPFGYVLLGTLFRDRWATRAARLGLAALAAWLLASVASAYPYYIPYFNELVPDRKLAYRILSDSNVDWRQAEGELRDYLRRHPEAHYAPSEPVAGRVVIGATFLTGVLEGERFAWLRPLTPVDHIGYSLLVFDVPEEVAAQARAATRSVANP